MKELITLPYPVPYAAQLASPELTAAIFDQGLDPRLDPRWAESGAATPEEYAYWTGRACGAACVQMAWHALAPGRPRLMDLVRAGLARDGYLIQTDRTGNRVERGWKHQALVDLLREAGLQAEVRPSLPADLLTGLRRGWLWIVSVSYELGTGQPVTHQGGHLVVVTGLELEDGQIAAVCIHNPSGRTPALRENAWIPLERFQAAFSGRAIAVWTTIRTPDTFQVKS